MRKIDLIDEVHGLEGVETHKGATGLVEATFHLMKQGIVTDGNLKISKFGTFIVKKKEERRGRNPQTDEPITIQPRSVLSFKPSATLKNMLKE